jgi:hypothetical protein
MGLDQRALAVDLAHLPGRGHDARARFPRFPTRPWLAALAVLPPHEGHELGILDDGPGHLVDTDLDGRTDLAFLSALALLSAFALFASDSG